MEIRAYNVNHAFEEVFWALKRVNPRMDPEPEQTRNGPVWAFPEPTIITYDNPCERVLFHSGRDANPMFHLMESLWILAGRNDVGFLGQFNSRIRQYSDNGSEFNAAYGYRMRKHFGSDQLLDTIKTLRDDPKTRQAVITLWDVADLTKSTLDKACNMQVVFDRRAGALNMTVFNRSNDLWWGALGANAVHFSFLQEFVALALGEDVGRYRQVSNNMHLYTELYDAGQYLKHPPMWEEFDLYSSGQVEHMPMMSNGDYMGFLSDCELFCNNPRSTANRYNHEFFHEVAYPMAMISFDRKQRIGTGRPWADKIAASDWRRACLDWIDRREQAKEKA